MQWTSNVVTSHLHGLVGRTARVVAHAPAVFMVAVACTPAAQPPAAPVPLEGCLRLVYGDPPPPGGRGSARFMLDAGDGVLHTVRIDSGLVRAAGGIAALDHARVRLEVIPASDHDPDAPPVATSISRLDPDARRPC